ncbi:MAG: LacI family DNA-binding transcriptional regulator [Actinomycetales bacterium]
MTADPDGQDATDSHAGRVAVGLSATGQESPRDLDASSDERTGVADHLPGDSPPARVRMIDVAARAGVSAATASRTLRGLSRVSPQTRQRVLDAARELEYRTAPEAEYHLPDRRRSVALIVPFMTRWFFATVTAAAAAELRGWGCDVLLYSLATSSERDEFFERLPLPSRVEAVLTLAMPLTERHTLSLRALDIPLVSVGAPIPGTPSVGIDDRAAARAAVSHLVNLKHERIGLLRTTPDDPRFDFEPSRQRELGYRDALLAAGLTPDDRLVARGPYGVRGGAAAMTRLLTGPQLPTAVFAESDELALGAIRALRLSGLRVPRDVSVVGIDDHEMAELFDLTTVAQQASTQGEVAARLLLRSLGEQVGDADGAEEEGDRIEVATRLILRGSTAPAWVPPERTADDDL